MKTKVFSFQYGFLSLRGMKNLSVIRKSPSDYQKSLVTDNSHCEAN